LSCEYSLEYNRDNLILLTGKMVNSHAQLVELVHKIKGEFLHSLHEDSRARAESLPAPLSHIENEKS